MFLIRPRSRKGFKTANAFDALILLWRAKDFPNWTFAAPLHRTASSSSNRWQNRQAKDKFVKLAKVQGLKSRAAFKLLEVSRPVFEYSSPLARD